MIRILKIWALMFLLLTVTCHDEKVPIQQGEKTDQIIVKFDAKTQRSEIDSIADELGLTFVKKIPELDLFVYRIPNSSNIHTIIDSCRSLPEVGYAEPDYRVRTFDSE